MPFVNGVMKRLQSWAARQAAGAPISATEFDADGNDVALALSDCLLRDGTSVPTADIPWGGKGITGLRQAAAAGEPVEFAQWKSGTGGVLNLLQNASFNVNVRGVSGTVTLAANAYGHDRWKAGSGGCSYTYSQNGADAQITILSGSLLQIVHAADIAGGVCTLGQNSGGTAQGRIYQGTTTAFAALPFQSGALVGGLAATVEFGPGTVFQPQLEAGSSQHAYSRKSITADAIACAAYYEVQSLDVAYYSGTTFRIQLPFATPKMAAPTVSVTPTPTGNPLGLTATAQTITRFNTNIAFGNIGSAGTFPWAGTVAVSCEP